MSREIPDSQVDLCGELGHEAEDDFTPIGLEEPFGFVCQGCADCCKGRQDIVLSGYDLYRLCRRLSLPPELVINGFCRLYMGSLSLLPVVRLRPRKDSGNNCPFLYKNRCSVHEARPLVCALYPLGQTIEQDGRVWYFCQDQECGRPRNSASLKEFLEQAGILAREGQDVEWARLNLSLSRRVRKAAPRLQRIRLKLAQRKICHALYLDYDPARDYLPQLRENLARLEPALARLLEEN